VVDATSISSPPAGFSLNKTWTGSISPGFKVRAMS
jgi:hypothetical protein